MDSVKYVSGIFSRWPFDPHLIHTFEMLIQDPDVTTDGLAQKILESPVATAKILRFANTSLFGKEGEVTDLFEATALLGKKTVLDLVKTRQSQNSVFSEEWCRGFDRKSLHCARVCEKLGQVLGIESSRTLYIAGLIHNLGWIASYYNAKNVEEHCPEEISETMTHVDWGKLIAELWGLPLVYVETMYAYPNPLAFELQHSQLVSIVNVASYLTSRQGIGPEMPSDIQELDQELVLFLNLTYDNVSSTLSDIKERFGNDAA